MARGTCWVIIWCCLLTQNAVAVPGRDDLDSISPSTTNSETADVETLLKDAQDLFGESRPLDARSKLIKALELAPKDYRPHMLLGAYYLSEVGHFQMAFRYLQTAEKYFEEKYGSDRLGTLDRSIWSEHARLLYLLAEAYLNLDAYQRSLETLDRFGRFYWDPDFPGTKAWVLMKLKRIDDAISVAQAGLMVGAEPSRTYNILGILLSLKGNRQLSLDAFARSIAAELGASGNGRAATPLNNSGEVYRELFADDMAEASWLKALQMPDNCEHILPSLNIANLYIDQLRLFQAERVLNDFRACFAQNSLRSDTEHRGLLALAEGRIALRKGDAVEAVSRLNQALERKQWFGKIGTNENDLRFAATISMGQALQALAANLSDVRRDSTWEAVTDGLYIPWLRLRSWWYFRRARELALDELDDFEDLFVRNTDTMLEYPTLGNAVAGFPLASFRARVKHISKKDMRSDAKIHYSLYLATSLLAHGETDEALVMLRGIKAGLRKIDRLARAETLALIAQVLQESVDSWFHFDTEEERLELLKTKEELFSLLPSHLRHYNLALPVVLRQTGEVGAEIINKKIRPGLLDSRFELVGEDLQHTASYLLVLAGSASSEKEKTIITTSLYRKDGEKLLAEISRPIVDSRNEDVNILINDFVAEVFRHQVDPAAEAVPKLKLFE